LPKNLAFSKLFRITITITFHFRKQFTRSLLAVKQAFRRGYIILSVWLPGNGKFFRFFSTNCLV